MSLFLFFTIIGVSLIVVRIGAIAFELAGLSRPLAKFQALSCFTGTGFTTKESELVVNDPQRRHIASILMVLGNAGLVTLIATFANTLRTSTKELPFQAPGVQPNLVPWINMAIVVSVLFVGYYIFVKSGLSERFTDMLRNRIIKKGLVRRISFEELVVSTGGYGVSKVEMCEKSQIINKTLAESGLREQDVSVLAIERENITIPNPPASEEILLGDKLICFGKLGTMKNKLCVVD